MDNAGGSTYLCDGNIWIPKASPQNALKLAKGASCQSADGWRLIRGNCFKKFEQPENWVNALYECRQQARDSALLNTSIYVFLKREQRSQSYITADSRRRL